ncbi:MAG: non-canonical purine NTP pyrophosphatase, partial [Verrucomicrobiae bacterium]|nr:non-canonical purine NTP pyrophosphatase [Verrucomicrobiae bacterium]NNJ85967.1 non-canonical purine NTP pyrophosphatase [Akkermansiaceae bacterium]
TFAELGKEIKNGLSHRARAMGKVVAWLAKQV